MVPPNCSSVQFRTLLTTLNISQYRSLLSSIAAMGRENIVHYQLEHDHETDLTQTLLRSPPEKISPRKPAAGHDNFPFSLSKELTIQDYLANNRYFVDSIHHNHLNQVFELNGKGQSPHTLWIGCSDSRAGESCLATLPGEVFTHRNIANVITASDISSQGVIQFAVDVLKVRKIIVCGHTDCGGVWASLSNKRIGGVLDLWLNPIRHIRAANKDVLAEFRDDPRGTATKLAELNVVSSVLALKRHPSALMALKKGEIEVYGMMYEVGTGLLREVEIPTDEFEDMFHIHDGHDEEYNPH
ncbi:CIC11C00000002829 [Sungouiella intermedia]|uniref:Carbonic anhydrase n=1 Tax=Sungouiella intermedia TaxID=45354 RepID=A0A1L0FU12_9ASCO|nr:CIC11C00000002829 [[Candida] intermedia]SGZ48948.1 CIC11C00000002673 [[Candida] intermedia]